VGGAEFLLGVIQNVFGPIDTSDERADVLVQLATPLSQRLTDAGQAAAKLSQDNKAAITWSLKGGCDKRLFDLTLPVIWNGKDKSRSPDAFITGTIFVDKDFKGVRVELMAFTKEDPAKPKILRTLTGPTVGGWFYSKTYGI